MNLVMYPERFDVIVTTNLFGDILSDLCAGLVGGLGMAPGANIGEDTAIFEAVHGSAPDIAGKNLANPTSVILASIQMLEYLEMKTEADNIRNAVRDVIESGDRTTHDLGGTHGTTDFTQAILERL
jgi:isocitrate dehydrogenase (NAD+)